MDSFFLRIPPELRLRIYAHLFEELTVTLRFNHAKASFLESDDVVNDAAPLSAHDPNKARMHPDPGHPSAVNSGGGMQPCIAILLVCRKAYVEARPVFFQTVTFRLKTKLEDDREHSGSSSHHRLGAERQSPLPFEAPSPPDAVAQMIQHLEIPHSLLPNGAPTPLHALFPRLTTFSITRIPISLAHQSMTSLDPQLRTLHQPSASHGSSPKHDIEHSPGLRVFQTLLCAMEEEPMGVIMAHFAACHGRYALRLHFELRCRHVGQLVVPGMFPMANAPHRHPEREVTYTFNANDRG